MATTLSSSVLAVDDTIQLELNQLRSRAFEGFRCAGAILYLIDPFSSLLEPAFSAINPGTADLAAMPPEPGQESSGLESVAFKSGKVSYSLKPQLDQRVGEDAQMVRKSYGISGSMMACPVIDAVKNCKGVLFVFSDDLLDADPVVAGKQFEDEAKRFSILLLQREKTLLEESATKYHDLTLKVLQTFRPIRTFESYTKLFTEYCRSHLRSDWVIMHVSRLIRNGKANVKSLAGGHTDADRLIDIVRNHVTPDAPMVLNRPKQNPSVYARLSEAAGVDNHVWVAVQLHDKEKNLQSPAKVKTLSSAATVV